MTGKEGVGSQWHMGEYVRDDGEILLEITNLFYTINNALYSILKLMTSSLEQAVLSC
jgi:hypothetical protein